MRKLFILFLLSAFSVFATDINVVYSFVDGLGQTNSVSKITFTPLYLSSDGQHIVTSNTVTRVTSGASYTNAMKAGIAYAVNYYPTAYGSPSASFTNYFPSSLTNGQTVDAVDYMSFGFSFGTFSYGIEPGTNVLFQTNGTAITISSSGGGTTYTNTTAAAGVISGSGIGTNTSGIVTYSSIAAAGGVTNEQTGVTLNGTFTGNGSGLTNLNASSLSSGTVPLARLPAAVVTNNEANVSLSGTFAGTFAGNLNNGVSHVGTNFVATYQILANSFSSDGDDPVVALGNWLWSDGTLSGDGSGLTNLNASALASGTVPLNVLPSAVVTNNEANVSLSGPVTVNGNLQVTGDLPVRKKVNIPINNFAVGSGALFNTAGIYSDSPFYTQPAIQMINAGGTTHGNYYLSIPDWVTNAVFMLEYEYAGDSPLTWTNRVRSDARVDGVGRLFSVQDSVFTFTLKPVGYTWVSVTNTFPVIGAGTNFVKYINFTDHNLVPTNTAKGVFVTQVRAIFTGNYTGTNW